MFKKLSSEQPARNEQSQNLLKVPSTNPELSEITEKLLHKALASPNATGLCRSKAPVTPFLHHGAA